MKTDAKAEIAGGGSLPAAKSANPLQGNSNDLALKERRKILRPIPAPDAVESDGDTDWALFQALISEKPTSGSEPESGAG